MDYYKNLLFYFENEFHRSQVDKEMHSPEYGKNQVWLFDQKQDLIVKPIEYVRKNMGVNENEGLSNITLRHKI